MDPLAVVATWLHTIGFVIAWGYYGVLARIVVPTLERSADTKSAAGLVAGIERRAVPLVGLSVGLFLATGTWLLVASPHYAGLGNVFASTWTALMLVKHLVIVGLVAAGIAVDGQVRRLAAAHDESERRAAFGRLRLAADAATGLGALVALLTALARTA